MRLAAPLPPGAAIGILGGGQLGRMLALAAARLGLNCHIYAPEADSPGFQVAARATVADYADEAALERFAASVGVVTYEFENVPAATAVHLEARVPVAPSASVLATTQDRLTEKTFLWENDIPVAGHGPVADEEDMDRLLGAVSRPMILKQRRFGYDGKGQVRVQCGDRLEEALDAIGRAPAILEEVIDFETEISVIAARGWDGGTAVYDVPENQHENHILRRSLVPAPIAPELAAQAQRLALRVLGLLDYVGVAGVEMFVAGSEGARRIIVNEIAPRVHNSGHWTLDACAVSQFEQHIRAVAGWPLGASSRHSDATMTNLLGEEAGAWAALAAEPGACLHLYGKAKARPGRKMGHVTRLTPRQD